MLPTALSLHRTKAYHRTACHHCAATETIDHLLLHCPNLKPFWSLINRYVTDISDGHTHLTEPTALFGLQRNKSNVHRCDEPHLINFILQLARYAIHKSAVGHRLNNERVEIFTIFSAKVKGVIESDFVEHKAKGTTHLFKQKWCINDVIARVSNDRLSLQI